MTFHATDRTVNRCGVSVETRRENKDKSNKYSPLTFSYPKPRTLEKRDVFGRFKLCVATRERDKISTSLLISNLYQPVRNSSNLK